MKKEKRNRFVTKNEVVRLKVFSKCSVDFARLIFFTEPLLHLLLYLKVYKPDRRIILRRPGLLIIRAIGISAGALPSKVFTSKRFWVLEGNVGHSSEEDDAVSITTEDFEAELQSSGPGPVRLLVQLC